LTFSVDRDDRVARFDPAPRSRRALEDAFDLEPALDFLDAEPDAGEVPGDLFVELFEVFRREVVGEAVVEVSAQPSDHPLQGGILEFGPADRAVVVVLDQFGRLDVEAGRGVDEALADEGRQLAGVAAEPEPDEEDGDQRGRKGDDPSGPHARLRPSGSGAA
jgi:hypothetical protein